MEEIKSLLATMAEPEYKDFSSRLLPGVETIVGVRLPKLRQLAKQIAKEDWQGYLASATTDTFEETMLQGMVIGAIQASFDTTLEQIKTFVPKIDNWSVCDSFCASLKSVTLSHTEEMWQFLQPYFTSPEPCKKRFALVMSLQYFIHADKLSTLFSHVDTMDTSHYYVMMGVAWMLSISYLHFPNETEAYLASSRLTKTTYNQTLQKIIESRRSSPQVKEQLRKMKKR